MPLRLPQLSFAITCEGNELEMFDVKQEDPSSMTAFMASEAGKEFRVTYENHMVDCDLSLLLIIDGETVRKSYVRAREVNRIVGIAKGLTSVLPFKFQELELVDPDEEDAPVVPEMGTIEVRAFRTRALRVVDHQPHEQYGLHRGRVSERSKKAGWHHVSTGDEIPTDGPTSTIIFNYVDRPKAPCATFKVFYRPRALLMAQGVIPGEDVPVETSGGPGTNDRKRTREDVLPGPSKRHAGPAIKSEEMSGTARAQRIRDLQAELNSLTDGRPGSAFKRELRSPSPIVVGSAAGEVVDLTLED